MNSKRLARCYHIGRGRHHLACNTELLQRTTTSPQLHCTNRHSNKPTCIEQEAWCPAPALVRKPLHAPHRNSHAGEFPTMANLANQPRHSHRPEVPPCTWPLEVHQVAHQSINLSGDQRQRHQLAASTGPHSLCPC